MKTAAHKISISLLCFSMSLMLFAAVFAAGESAHLCDTGVITGFEPAYFTNHEFTDEKGLNTGDTISINEGVNYLNAGGNDSNASFALFNMPGPVQKSGCLA